MYPRRPSSSLQVPLTLSLIWLMMLCPIAAAQGPIVSRITFTGHTGVPQPSLSAQAPSPESSYPSDTHFVALHANKMNSLIGITLLNSKCKLISTGTYTTTKGPTYGKQTDSIVEITVPDGPCKGTKKTKYNLASYTWTSEEAPEPQDFFHLHWKADNPYGGVVTDDTDWLPERLPTEQTEFKAWYGPDFQTVAFWKVTLQPPKINYQGVTVHEIAPYKQHETCSGSNCTPDTCWFNFDGKKSTYPAQITISDPDGKVPITIGKNNVWYDTVGWGPGLVEYYRKVGRANGAGCGTTYPQQMQIRFATGDPKFYNYGPVNTLGGSFTDTTVTSTRAGVSKSEPWK